MARQALKQWVCISFLLPALLRPDGVNTGEERLLPDPAEEVRKWTEGRLFSEGPLPGWLRALTEDIAFEHGLSPHLVRSIILTESQGDPRKVSSKGAKGLMQLMPVVVQHYRVSDPYDPLANIQAGVQYLVNLLEQFSGDLPLALAAYNAGPTAVRKYRGIPPFAETQAFVLRVSELFHSLEPGPRIVRLAMNSGGGEPAAADSRPMSFSGSPRSLSMWLKKFQPENREAQVQ